MFSFVAFLEEEPLHPARPSSRASTATARDSSSQCTVTEDPRSPRSLSQTSSDRRPMGPRSPSPLPPSKSPPLPDLPSMDDELADQLTSIVQPTPTRSGIPRSKRQIFQSVNNVDSTPKPHVNGTTRPPSFVEPLSIKKKTSVRTAPDSSETPVHVRKGGRNSLTRTPGKMVASSPRRVSPQIRLGKVLSSVSSPHMVSDLDKIISLARTTKEDVSLFFFLRSKYLLDA